MKQVIDHFCLKINTEPIYTKSGARVAPSQQLRNTDCTYILYMKNITFILQEVQCQQPDPWCQGPRQHPDQPSRGNNNRQ